MKGRVLYSDDQRTFLANGRHLYLSNDSGTSWMRVFSFNCTLLITILIKIRLIQRLLRLGCQKIETVSDCLVCVFNKKIYWISLHDYSLLQVDSVVGGAPLNLCIHEDAVYYGEYHSNSDRSPVSIFSANAKNRVWRAVLTLDNVRHIHGIYFDEFTYRYWVTTGDSDEESFIRCYDLDFTEYIEIASGSQQARVVQPIFEKDFVLFATDAPNEKNYIYRFDRDSRKIERLASVPGPVYFAKKFNGRYLFATVVEPSKVNDIKMVHLISSQDFKIWNTHYSSKKDCFSMKYFQYGQFVFASGSNAKHLFISEISTVFDCNFIRFSKDDI